MTLPQQKMPGRIYLCTVHFQEFYVPEDATSTVASGRCPEGDCDGRLIEFTRGPVCRSCMDSGIQHYGDPTCTPENDPCPDCRAGVLA